MSEGRVIFHKYITERNVCLRSLLQLVITVYQSTTDVSEERDVPKKIPVAVSCATESSTLPHAKMSATRLGCKELDS